MYLDLPRPAADAEQPKECAPAICWGEAELVEGDGAPVLPPEIQTDPLPAGVQRPTALWKR